MKLVCCRKKQPAHVHGQEVGAVSTSNCDGLKQTTAGNTHLNTQPKTRRRRSKGAKHKYSNQEEREIREIREREGYRQDSVAEVAMDITQLIGGGEVVR